MLENIYPAYKECSKCGKRQKNNEAYFICKDNDCGYQEPQHSQVLKEEKNTEITVKKMVKELVPSGTPKINICSEASIVKYSEFIRCGWYEKPPLHQISIPRKSLYLPRKELTDLVAHECAHPVSWEEDEKNFNRNLLKGWNDIEHGPLWYDTYIRNYHQLTNQYSTWINEKHKARFTTGEKIPNSRSEYRDSLIYDPYEDD